MDEQPNITVQLAVLQSIVERGFQATHDRLDKVNGRVYTGEKERADIDKRVAVLESKDEQRREPPGTGKLVGVGASAAGAIVALWEMVKPFLPHVGP